MIAFFLILFAQINMAFANEEIQLCDEVESLCDDITCPISNFQYKDIHLVHKLLQEAETYYQLARETENGYFTVQNSAIRYVQARKCIETLPEQIQKKQDVTLLYERVKEAEMQSIYRLDNAHDTIRSVMWPIWWIIEADPTVEWYDDVFMKATELLWNKIAVRIEKYPMPSIMPVVIRMYRNPNLGPKSALEEDDVSYRIDLMRDELIGHSEGLSNTFSLPDDRGNQIFGTDWKNVITYDQTRVQQLTAEENQLFRDKLGSKFVMVVEVEILDEIKKIQEPSIVRLKGNFSIIDTINNKVVYEGNVQSVAQDVRKNNSYAVFWVLGLFGFAMCTAVLKGMKHKSTNDMSNIKIFLFAVFGFCAGSMLGELADQISTDFLLEWGTPSYVREWAPEDIGLPAFLPFDIIIPYVPIFFWPFVHGAVVMVGPLFVIGWINNKLSDYIKFVLDKPEAQISIIAPTAQAGATTWMFYPLVEGMGDNGQGLYLALCLSVTAISISYVMAIPMSKAINLSFGFNQNATFKGLIASSIALLLLLPIGLFDAHYLWATAIGLSACLYTYTTCKHIVLGSEAEIERDDLTIDININQGSLDKPAWLEFENFDLVDLVSKAKERQIIHINGMTKYGATRTLDVLRERLKAETPNSYSIKVVLTQPDSAGAQPYELIQLLYEKFGLNNINLASKEEQASVTAEALIQAGGLMAGISPIGMVFDMFGDTESTGNHQRSRIIEDATKWLIDALEQHSKNKQGHYLQSVFIENIHWADPSSLEVLQRYFELCSEQSETYTHQPSFIFNSTSQDEQWLRPIFDTLEEQERLVTINLPKLTLEKAKDFVTNKVHIHGLSDSFIQSLLENSEGSVGGLHLLLVLMRDTGLLIERTRANQTYYEAKEGLHIDEVWESLPSDAMEQELLRLQQLDSEAMYVIRCAAICGNSFSVEEVVYGTQIAPHRVILALESIEKLQPPIIEDNPFADGCFRFINNLSRIALCKKMQYIGVDSNSISKPRELAKMMHRNIIEQHLKYNYLQPMQIIQHTLPLQEYPELLADAVLELFDNFYKKSAWPEIVKVYDNCYMQLPDIKVFPKRARIEMIIGEALRNTGKVHDRHRSIQILDNLIQGNTEVFDSTELLQLYFQRCEAQYELASQDRSIYTILENWCTQQLTQNHSNLIQLTLEFYKVLSAPPMNPASVQLESMLHRFTEQDKNGSRTAQLLYSSVLQTFANKATTEKMPQAQEYFRSRMDEANQIKTRIGDVQGIAMNRGITGNFYLFTQKDSATALELYQEDLVVVKENNLTSDFSSIWNRIATCHLNLYAQNNNIEDLQKSFQAVTQSLTYARKTSRIGDYIFTLSNMVKVLEHYHQQNQNDLVQELDDLVDELNIGTSFVSKHAAEIHTSLAQKSFLADPLQLYQQITMLKNKPNWNESLLTILEKGNDISKENS